MGLVPILFSKFKIGRSFNSIVILVLVKGKSDLVLGGVPSPEGTETQVIPLPPGVPEGSVWHIACAF